MYEFRIYRDSLGKLQAEALDAPLTITPTYECAINFKTLQDKDGKVFFDGIPADEAIAIVKEFNAFKYGVDTIAPELLIAIGDEGTRVNLQDKEEYYALFVTVPRHQEKYTKRISNELNACVVGNGGWLNHIILRDGDALRYDLATSKPKETERDLAIVMKRYFITDWKFKKNDF